MAVYFIQAGPAGPIKIGFAIDPRKRRRDLQTSHYETLVLLGALPGMFADERALHRRMRASRIRGEWFHPSAEVLALVATSSMNIDSAMRRSREQRIIRLPPTDNAKARVAVTRMVQSVLRPPAGVAGRFKSPRTALTPPPRPAKGAEYEALETALAHAGGNATLAAKALGCTRHIFVAKRRELGRALRKTSGAAESPA